MMKQIDAIVLVIAIVKNPVLEHLSDAELCALVLKENANAFPVLLGRFMSVIQAKAARFGRVAGADTDDFVQDGMLALYRAAKGYRPDRGAQFRTYAASCIQNSMTASVKAYIRMARRREDISLDELDDAPQHRKALADSSESAEDAYAQQEAMRHTREQMHRFLSKLESEALELYLQGSTYQAIAGMLGVPSKTVDNALQRVRRKLKRPPESTYVDD